MSTIAQLEDDLQSQLDEAQDGVGIFWSVPNELRPALVEAMNEATVITGDPQFRAATSLFNIPTSTIFTPLALPNDAVALLRVEGPGSLALHKYTVWDLDRHFPGWEVATGPTPLAWIPFGLGQFGIYPNLTAPAQVIISYVQMPVTTAPPWDGTQVIPFQAEYLDGFKDAAQHYLQFKEGDPEFTQSFGPYNRFLASCERMSNFAWRKNSLRFTRSGGASSAITQTRAK
jgi:hypothetical protein